MSRKPPIKDEQGTLNLRASGASSSESFELRSTLCAGTLEPQVQPHIDFADFQEKQGRYQRMRTLGRGGMSEVYLYQDELLGRSTARKTLIPELQESTECRRRFLREIRIQAQLAHPAIVPVFDCGVDEDGCEFFHMRSIRGITLQDAVKQLSLCADSAEIRRERNRLLSAFLQVCLAIDYAHHRGVVHRDIKPNNLMLGRFGEVYVLDWGVAKVIAEQDDVEVQAFDKELSGLSLATLLKAETEGRTLLGTPAYMSPEQFVDSSQVTPLSDVYSLGAVLFYILAMEPLRLHNDLDSFGDWPKDKELEPGFRSPNNGIVAEYDYICRKACSPNKDERYRSARELHDAVEAVLRGDRDLDLRKRIAEEHLARAKTLDTEDKLSEALVLQEAGRALTLEPTNTEAMAFLSQKMLNPMKTKPDELKAEQRLARTSDARRALRNNAMATGAVLFSLLLLLPFLTVRDWRGIGAMLGFPAIGACILAFTNSDDDVHWVAIIRSVMVGVTFSVPIVVSAFIFGPFVLPPLLTCVVCTLVAGVINIGWRRLNIISIAMCSYIATILAYQFGGVAIGLTVQNGIISQKTYVLTITQSSLLPILGFFSSVIIFANVFVVWKNMDALLKSRQQLQEYEWKLRQATSMPVRQQIERSTSSP